MNESYQNNWLAITSYSLRGDKFTIMYHDFEGVDHTTVFSFSKNMETALKAVPFEHLDRLLSYIAVANAVYMYNFAYFSEIRTSFALSEEAVTFFEDYFFHGLAEFKYANNLDIHAKIRVVAPRNAPLETLHLDLHGALVGNGGGKDGAVGFEIASATIQDAGWYTWNLIGSRREIVEKSGATHNIHMVDEHTPSNSPSQNPRLRYKGHKPTGGLIGLLTALAALADGKRYAIVSNEISANETTIHVDGVDINHQYTKTFAFEVQLSQLITSTGLGVQYFSILRPLYELQIMRLFEQLPQYHDSFISCNKGTREGYWCLECAKCAFIILGITALDPRITKKIWGDALIIAQPKLRPHILALVSPDLDKPFECVGTLDECRLALYLIFKNKEFYDRLPKDFREQTRAFIPINGDALKHEILLTIERPHNFPVELADSINDYLRQHLG